MKPITFAILILATLPSIPRLASAHAFLDESDPPVGSQIEKSPPEIKIWFTKTIRPDSSAIQLFDSSGNEFDKKDSHGDANDGTLLTVSIQPLNAGTYKVEWQAVCSDGHHTKGDYQFTVKSK